MSDGSLVVVIKARDYRMTEPMLDAFASEFEGYRVDLAGASDDIHYEFRLSQHRDLFLRSLNIFRI